tara:strand:- start:15 stop:674 length:660 start_codon:yes stop_codon:yes gene_type:complete
MKPIINDFIFYKITNEDFPDYVYIGSTSNFIQRKYSHKGSCNNPNSKKHHFKLYKTIRENGGWDRWEMLVVDKLEQSTLTEARIKEEELRLKYNGTMNSQKAHTILKKNEYAKEYHEKNKDEILDRHKKYRENNKDEISEKNKEYRENNKDELKEKAKEYNENHKNETKEYNKEYRKANKDVLNEKKKEKITCECGSIFSKGSLSRHIKTNKHLIFINK